MALLTGNRKASEIKALVDTYMVETYTRYNFLCTSAKGMFLYDEKGQAYLDFYGGVAVNSTGNSNEKVVAAVQAQVAEVTHTFNYPYTIPQALLAEKICTTLGFEKIFYQNSGTEANEAMIKMARKYGIEHKGPNCYHIITAKKGFHGRSYGALSATGQPDNACQTGFKPMLPGFTYADFNDLASFEAQVTDNTIGIMIEPVQGEGGVIPATPEFMQGLRKLCDDRGLLLLFDEIQTGWCRTGEIMAFMDYDVKPDILTMAKAMGGGMPISAVVTSSEIATAFSMGSHGSTYGGNAVCCAAALAQIDELMERNLADNARDMGNYFMKQLRKLPGIKEVRGKGLLIGVEYESPIGLEVKHNCFDQKLLVTLIGDRIIRMIPPLIASKKDVDQALSILKAATEQALTRSKIA